MSVIQSMADLAATVAIVATSAGSHTHTPTMAPSPLPYTALYRQLSTILAYAWSIVNRVLIGWIAASRLMGYRKAGLLQVNEIKTAFHITLLLTLPLTLPYYTFCEIYSDRFQCWFQQGDSLFRTSWVLYELFRLGLPLQLAGLSMTVLMWSDFLFAAGDVRGRRRYVSKLLWPEFPRDSAPFKLRVVLLGLNLVVAVFNSVSALICMVQPSQSVDSDNASRVSSLTYISWMAIDVAQLVLVLVLIRYGWLVRNRIQATAVFDDRARGDMLQTLNVILGLLVFCLAVEISFRTILSWQWLTQADHQTTLTQFLQWNPILWQFTAYVMPYDCVSFLLLYLMRTPPQKDPRLQRQSQSPAGVQQDPATQAFVAQAESTDKGISPLTEKFTAINVARQPLLEA